MILTHSGYQRRNPFLAQMFGDGGKLVNGKKLMVVDDAEIVQIAFEKFFTKKGFQVIVIKTADEAVSRYQEISPDLVLMDVLMETGMNGIVALKKIREIDPSAKVLLVTNLDHELIRTKSEELGAIGFVRKSAVPEKLEKLYLLINDFMNP